MEVVLQWFDELDDLVFSGAIIWQRSGFRRLARRVCLGAATACTVYLTVTAGIAPGLA